MIEVNLKVFLCLGTLECRDRHKTKANKKKVSRLKANMMTNIKLSGHISPSIYQYQQIYISIMNT